MITTKDRGDMVCRTVRSVLECRYDSFEVVLVDQSESDVIEPVEREFRDDERLRYVRSATVGISAARNVGARMARGELIANTDDDCEVPTDWLDRIAAMFEEWPDAAILFGDVDAAPHPRSGFIPAYHVARPSRIRGLWRKYQIEGIGACFAYRRELWHSVGGFDERLGVGGEFRSAEEVDFAIRALAQGRVVGETSAFGVIHFGFRRWDQAEDLLEAHLFGLGGMSAKHLRRHPLQYGYVLAQLGVRWFWGRPVVDFGHRPGRRTRLRAFLRGLGGGWRLPMTANETFVGPDTIVATAAVRGMAVAEASSEMSKKAPRSQAAAAGVAQHR